MPNDNEARKGKPFRIVADEERRLTEILSLPYGGPLPGDEPAEPPPPATDLPSEKSAG